MKTERERETVERSRRKEGREEQGIREEHFIGGRGV
jgi:hypothetical protein